MKNFKNKNLYKSETGLFDAVIESRVETNSEYNKTGKYRVGNEEDDIDTKIIDSGLTFDEFGSGGFGGFDDLSFNDGFGSINSTTNNPKSLPHDEWSNKRPAHLKVLVAPYWAIMYLYRGMLYDSPFRDLSKKDGEDSEDAAFGMSSGPDSAESREQDKILIKNFRIASLIVGILSFVELTGYINILIPPIVGVFAVLLSAYCDYYLERNYDQGIIIQLIQKLSSDDEDEELEGIGDFDEDLGSTKQELTTTGQEDDPFGSFNDTDFGGGVKNDPFAGFDGFDDTFDIDMDAYIEEDDDEEVDDDPEEGVSSKVQQLFPQSPINTKSNGTEFGQGLLEVFMRQNKNKGKIPRTRKDLLPEYAPYLPSNDNAFANWYDIKESSVEYNNIAFTLYKVLTQINGKFDISNTNKDKLTIIDMQRSPLLYKIEVKIPTYFRESQVLKSASIVENYLKESDNDSLVGCIITTFGGNYIFKFMRLDYKGLIAHGDIMRYEDPQTGVATVDLVTKDKGLPVLMGMKDNEYPYVFDLEDNTSGAIVGGSGSGKSWLTFQLMMNLITLNTPEELNFLILDAKDAALWKQFAKAPHVLGYHTNIYDYMKILTEIQAEHLRRAAFLSSVGVEDFKTYREMCKENGDYEALAKHPFLVVVMDEITFTMKQLRLHDKEAYDEFRATLSSLSTVVRSTGIRILAIGQRAIDTSIPKDYMFNASMKFAMKLDSVSEFDIMINKGWEKKVSRKPVNAGESLMLTQGQAQPQYVKTLIPGGTSTQTMLQLIRVISLDWVRRTIGTDIDYTQPPELMRDTINLAFNRHEFYTNALQDLQEGRILSSTEVSDGAQVNIEPGQSDGSSQHMNFSTQTQDLFGSGSGVKGTSKDELETPNTIKGEDRGSLDGSDDDPFNMEDDDLQDIFVDFSFDTDVEGDSDIIKEQETLDEQKEEIIEEPDTEEPDTDNLDTDDLITQKESMGVRGIGEALNQESESLGRGLPLGDIETTEDVDTKLESEETDEGLLEDFGDDMSLDDLIDKGNIGTGDDKRETETYEPYKEQKVEDDVSRTGNKQTNPIISNKPTGDNDIQGDGKEEVTKKVKPVTNTVKSDELFPSKGTSTPEVKVVQNKPKSTGDDWVKQAQLKHQKSKQKQVTTKRVPQVTGRDVVKASQDMPYRQNSQESNGLKPSIKQFIIKQGIKVGPFTRAVDTDLLRANYTPREIDIALTNLIIYVEGGYYVTDIS